MCPRPPLSTPLIRFFMTPPSKNFYDPPLASKSLHTYDSIHQIIREIVLSIHKLCHHLNIPKNKESYFVPASQLFTAQMRNLLWRKFRWRKSPQKKQSIKAMGPDILALKLVNHFFVAVVNCQIYTNDKCNNSLLHYLTCKKGKVVPLIVLFFAVRDRQVNTLFSYHFIYLNMIFGAKLPSDRIDHSWPLLAPNL